MTLSNAMIALAFGLFLDQYRPLVKIDHPLNLWLSQRAKSGSSVIFKVKHGKDKGTEKVQTNNISLKKDDILPGFTRLLKLCIVTILTTVSE